MQKITKDVYKLDVKADVKGSTLGAEWTAESMLDPEGKGISKEMNDLIGNLSSSVSRVALSTDRPVDFVVVTVRSLKEKMTLDVVRTVDDIRRAQAEALPVTESMNRTLFQQGVFDPATTHGAYKVHEWTLPDFLSKQILQRVRTAKPSDPANPIPSELYEEKVVTDAKHRRIFEFAVLSLKQEKSRENITSVLRAVRDVFLAYNYDAFDEIVIRDLIHQRKLVIGKSTMKIFEARKISEEELLNTRLAPDTSRPSAFKNALEVFGFNVT